MTKYLIAVSGGIDSVVLLNMAAKWPDAQLLVAHFDHGIRPDSASDRAFVESLAHSYGVPFIAERAELGANASEERARIARYDFLRRIAKDQRAQIVTAHHKDDVFETILINTIRGTGWRGLCSLRSGEIYRPLLEMTKEEIKAYASEQRLTWREDSTNEDERYMRNYLRRRVLPRLDEVHKVRLLELYKKQCVLHDHIQQETHSILADYETTRGHKRYIFIMSPFAVALELLHMAIFKATGKTMTRPQLSRALLATKTFRHDTRFQVGGGVELYFSAADMIVEEPRN